MTPSYVIFRCHSLKKTIILGIHTSFRVCTYINLLCVGGRCIVGFFGNYVREILLQNWWKSQSLCYLTRIVLGRPTIPFWCGCLSFCQGQHAVRVRVCSIVTYAQWYPLPTCALAHPVIKPTCQRKFDHLQKRSLLQFHPRKLNQLEPDFRDPWVRKFLFGKYHFQVPAIRVLRCK